MEAFFLDFRLKGLRISVNDGIYCQFPLFVVFLIGTISAVALWAAT
jgi:hypothetical protein